MTDLSIARMLLEVTGDALTAFREHWERAGVKNDVYPVAKQAALSLHRVVVPADDRGKGTGTKYMKELCAFADKRQLRIVLSPSTDFGGSSVARLVKFYKRFGFRENKGVHKDYAVSETMIREPR